MHSTYNIKSKALVNEPALLRATADGRSEKKLIKGGVIKVDISFNHDKYTHIVTKLWLNRPALDFWIISFNWFPTREVPPLVSVF